MTPISKRGISNIRSTLVQKGFSKFMTNWYTGEKLQIDMIYFLIKDEKCVSNLMGVKGCMFHVTK